MLVLQCMYFLSYSAAAVIDAGYTLSKECMHVLLHDLNILLWAWGLRWRWGWRPLHMSDNRIHWELWWLQDPAACSQISGRSIDAVGRTQTRSPEPGNRAETEQCKCQQKHSPNPHCTLTHRSSSHYRAAVIANSPPRRNTNLTSKRRVKEEGKKE